MYHIQDNSVLDHISSLISKHMSSGVTALLLTRLVPGALILAPFDNEYYRAKIIGMYIHVHVHVPTFTCIYVYLLLFNHTDIDTDSVLVRYLDHGNTCKVGVSELFEMNKKLVRIPPAVN